ncbi:MAG TPA: DUF2934 domain-containing protein [Gammaproteobacteria bacterium]
MAKKKALKAAAKSKTTVKKAVKKPASTKKAAKTAKTKSSEAKTTGKKSTASAATNPPTKKLKLAVKASAAKDDKRFTLIQQTAYYIAEKRGFAGGDPEQDWLLAEQQVDEMLNRSST